MSGRHGPGLRCPHCLSRATARTSTQLSRVYREVTYTCRNLNCGHVWVAGLESIRTLSPSSVPSPDVRLPFSQHVQVRQLAVQMSLALAATEPQPFQLEHTS